MTEPTRPPPPLEPPAPGGPSPRTAPAAHQSVHTRTTDLRGAMNVMARQLARDGWAVDLHGTVAHGPGAPVVPLLLAVSAFGALGATARPWLAAGLVLAAAGAVATDLAGGRSPLRALLPRVASRSLLVWPQGPPPPPPAHRPGADGAPVPVGPVDTRPTVLFAMPARIGIRGAHPLLAALSLGAAVLVAASGLLPAHLQDPFAVGAFATLLLLAVGALVGGRRRARAARRRPGTAALLRQLAGAVRTAPPARVRVGLAAVGALEPWLDPLETLLRNHQPLVPPAHTLVVVWEPAPGPLAAVVADGARGEHPASPQLVAALARLGLPTAQGSWRRPASGGLRARRSGWRAITLRGGGADPEAAVQSLHRLLGLLDSGAGAGEW